MSHRIEQVESTLQRAIAQVLQRQISDPRITGMISITQVKVTPDLATAFVHVSILPETAQNKTMYGLKHAARHIQTLVRKLVAIRPVPQLEFRLDDSLKKQAAVLDAINAAMDRTAEREAADTPDAGPDAAPTTPEDRDSA